MGLEQAIGLISRYEPKLRNCKVSRGRISLKSNEGTLQIIKQTKQTRERLEGKQRETRERLEGKQSRYTGVRIYTGNRANYSFLIYSNDTWFYRYTMSDVDFLKSCKKYIKEIDNSVIVDYNLMQAKSNKGIFSVKDFSTGLKTVLNILYILRQNDTNRVLVNVTECGDKVINMIFEIVNNSRIGIYLNHDVLDMADKFDYYVNDKKLDSVLDLIDFM